MPIINYIWNEVFDTLVAESNHNEEITVVYDSAPARYGKPVAQSQNNDVSTMHFDGDLSVRQISDSNETVTDTATYSAFGTKIAFTGSSNSPFGYKGAVGYVTDDDSGQIYVRARTYSPSLRRWNSVDPIAFFFISFNANAYLYVKNSPTNSVDPSGLLDLDDFQYGSHCGPSRAGGGRPYDEIDECCKIHDECLPNAWHFVIPFRVFYCDDRLFWCARRVLMCGACSASPAPQNCVQYGKFLLFFVAGSGTSPWSPVVF